MLTKDKTNFDSKNKVADCQVGHAYLTSHRACYVDDANPTKNSISIDLRDVERYEYTAGFLRASAKVTIHPKPSRKGSVNVRNGSALSQGVQRLQISSSSSPGSRSASPLRTIAVREPQQNHNNPGSWICPICTFTNPVPSNFDPAVATEAFPIPPCLTCGIKPPFALILKAAINAGSSSSATSAPAPVNMSSSTQVRSQGGLSDSSSIVCPRCTFQNHPSLRSCEICGAALHNTRQPTAVERTADIRSASPAPEVSHISESAEPVSVKFSFRAGGDKVFFDRLKAAMVQRKWLATNAPPVPTPLDGLRRSEPSSPTMANFDAGRSSPRSSRVGIAGLEQLGKQNQLDNETVIGAAFEDLESLMALDKEVSALAQRIAREFGDDASRTDFDLDSQEEQEPGMIATKDMLSNTSEKLYISELARNLAEYVTDERRGLLRKRGGTMSLVDLWATFNRSRDGVELVSPLDFQKATAMWADLGLPVRLRQFKSGLMAVQYAFTSDERTIEQMKKWLESLRSNPPEQSDWDWARFGCGVTAQDAAKKFGWSLGIASEELEMAEEKGALVREESIEGLKFWLNFLLDKDDIDDLDT